MKPLTTTLVLALTASTSLASAQDNRDPQDTRRREQRRCPEWAVDPCGAPHHDQRRPQQVWDPNLAQWRVEHPREVWDPNLAQWRSEDPQQVWDPYLAQYRPRDARKDPPPPARERERRSESRRRR